LVVPSLLSANFANLLPDIREMEEAGAELLHLDVMDGHFVPNITVGIPVLKSIKKVTGLPLDVHLMISNPDSMAEGFAEAGADWLTVHYESTVHLNRLLTRLSEQGVKPGVALNPHTPVLLLEETLFLCHHILIMSVNPGFGGQKFISNSFEKVRKLNDLILSQGLQVKIEIVGGIGPENTAAAVDSGVDVIVAGSAIFHATDPRETFRQMQQSADEIRAADSGARASGAGARGRRS
jgi:ribulose-phosphate 3-epimerase